MSSIMPEIGFNIL